MTDNTCPTCGKTHESDVERRDCADSLLQKLSSTPTDEWKMTILPEALAIVKEAYGRTHEYVNGAPPFEAVKVCVLTLQTSEKSKPGKPAEPDLKAFLNDFPFVPAGQSTVGLMMLSWLDEKLQRCLGELQLEISEFAGEVQLVRLDSIESVAGWLNTLRAMDTDGREVADMEVDGERTVSVLFGAFAPRTPDRRGNHTVVAV